MRLSLRAGPPPSGFVKGKSRSYCRATASLIADRRIAYLRPVEARVKIVGPMTQHRNDCKA
jgi:hypothetical protein